MPSGNYDPAYFSKLFAIEDRHFWFRARNHVIGALLHRWQGEFGGGYSFLEIGCGTGNVLHSLELVCGSEKVTGMDLFFEGLVFTQKRVNCSLIQGDMMNPPFEQAFNGVGLFDVLEHLEDDLSAFRSAAAMIKPDGLLFLTVPAYPSLWSYFDEAARHIRRYTRQELTSRLQEAELDILYLGYTMMGIFPLVWLQRRVRNRITRKELIVQEQTEEELRIIPVINELVAGELILESWWIRAGLALPFGTSLAAVARKRK